MSRDSPPKYQRAARAVGVRRVRAAGAGLLEQFPTMPATVLAERVGWAGSQSWFRKKVAAIRPEYRAEGSGGPAGLSAGRSGAVRSVVPAARSRWVPASTGSLPVLVMVASFSRFITAMMIPTRADGGSAGRDVVAADRAARGGARRLLWDNEAGIGRGGHLAEGVAAFIGMLAHRIVQLQPYDPESKGIVERANRYLETSFLPGRTLHLTDRLQRSTAQWLPLANSAAGARTSVPGPVDLIERRPGRDAALPPVARTVGFRPGCGCRATTTCGCSATTTPWIPTVIGRMIDVHADLDTRDRPAATARWWLPTRAAGRARQTVTDPAHVLPPRLLRGSFQPGRHADGR